MKTLKQVFSLSQYILTSERLLILCRLENQKEKLVSFGFDDEFIQLLLSYGTERYQSVKIIGNKMISAALEVTSGVPQGKAL